MGRLSISPIEITPLLSRTSLIERVCSDGQCCFFDIRYTGWPEGEVLDMQYWLLRYKKYFSAYGFDKEAYAACSQLEFDFEERENMLYLGSSCQKYEERNDECRKAGFDPEVDCHHKDYVDDLESKLPYKSLFLLVLNKEKFIEQHPFLEKFNLANQFPELDGLGYVKFTSGGIYIPVPADRKMLPG